MKVLVLIHRRKRKGGAVLQLMNIVQGLKQREIEVVVFSLDDQKIGLVVGFCESGSDTDEKEGQCSVICELKRFLLELTYFHLFFLANRMDISPSSPFSSSSLLYVGAALRGSLWPHRLRRGVSGQSILLFCSVF